MPSRSTSSRTPTACSRRTATASMPRRRPSSSSATRRRGAAPASIASTCRRRSRPARRSSHRWLDGHRLRSNAPPAAPPWTSFVRVRNRTWFHDRLVLIGDAAHTAHFSIGSGTKLAMEDAITLARVLAGPKPLAEALAEYQQERMTESLRLQNAARNSMEWFEHVERYIRLAPDQFAYSLLTRSQRVSHENLRLRDRDYLEGVERWFAPGGPEAGGRAAGADVHAVLAARHDRAQPGGGGADGHVQRGRRDAGRLPPGAPRHPRARRRRPGHHRDDVRVARGAHHAGMHGHVSPRARHRVAAHRGVRARAQRRADLPAARACRTEGLGQAALGRHRHPAGAGRLGGGRAVGGALRALDAGATRDDPGRHGPRP